jgi:hypothetical protein
LPFGTHFLPMSLIIPVPFSPSCSLNKAAAWGLCFPGLENCCFRSGQLWTEGVVQVVVSTGLWIQILVQSRSGQLVLALYILAQVLCHSPFLAVLVSTAVSLLSIHPCHFIFSQSTFSCVSLPHSSHWNPAILPCCVSHACGESWPSACTQWMGESD